MPPREGLPGLDSSIPFSPDPLDHVFLVIHGAGDPYIDHQPWLSSLETCVRLLDKNYCIVASDLSKTLRGASVPSAMFLPVEWHAAAHQTWRHSVRKGDPRPSESGAPPSVRDAVAETVGDILLMASPFWRSEVASHVATQMADQLAAVRRNRPAFSGRVSILAHSVGALLALELLQRDLLGTPVDAVVLTGCPVAAYAALAPDDGKMTALDVIRHRRAEIRFLNVYHPLDPVAYRLEPFVNAESDDIIAPVKVGPRKRSFWDDAEMFWDDVVFNLWSTLFPERAGHGESQRHNNASAARAVSGVGRNGENAAHEETGGDAAGVRGEGLVADLFSSVGSDEHSAAQEVNRSRRGDGRRSGEGRFRRAAAYRVDSGDEGTDGEGGRAGSEVLLCGRIDFELQDGMGVPPLDVMASWGAIKAHTYYWQSLDVAQILLDIAVTSEEAAAGQ